MSLEKGKLRGMIMLSIGFWNDIVLSRGSGFTKELFGIATSPVDAWSCLIARRSIDVSVFIHEDAIAKLTGHEDGLLALQLASMKVCKKFKMKTL